MAERGADLEGQPRFAGFAYACRGGEMRKRRTQAMYAPALVVERDQRGVVGVECVQVVAQRAERVRVSVVAGEQNDTARPQVGQYGAGAVVETQPRDTDDEALTDDRANILRRVVLRGSRVGPWRHFGTLARRRRGKKKVGSGECLGLEFPA